MRGGRGAMRRSLVGVLAALVLVPVVGSGVAAAGPPAPPTYAEATSVSWDLVTEEEWGTVCQLSANAVLDRPMAGGERVFAHVWVHTRFIDFDGYANPWDTWQIVGGRLGHGTASFSGTAGFIPTKYGHYEVDWVRFDLTYRSGEVIDSLVVNTSYGC
jgi:hypothetical protein